MYIHTDLLMDLFIFMWRDRVVGIFFFLSVVVGCDREQQLHRYEFHSVFLFPFLYPRFPLIIFSPFHFCGLLRIVKLEVHQEGKKNSNSHTHTRHNEKKKRKKENYRTKMNTNSSIFMPKRKKHKNHTHPYASLLLPLSSISTFFSHTHQNVHKGKSVQG